ncbi:MAG: hypothetical protein Phog2KO_50240 [Phototrophicaceae bacterium]
MYENQRLKNQLDTVTLELADLHTDRESMRKWALREAAHND